MDITFKRETFVNDTGLTKLIELQNEVYKGRYQFTPEVFEFWYLNNPQGIAYSFSAYDGEKMVANYSCIPSTLYFYGEILHGIHSMGVVTHPDYQGMGLFRKLAELTNNCAKQEGKDFVIAVSNASSTPGFIKHLGFTLISPLDVRWGWGEIIPPASKKIYKVYDAETLNWRLNKPKYSKCGNSIYGKHGTNFGIKTYMGLIDPNLIRQINIPSSRNLLRPLNLYIGLGADLSKGHYFKFPSFIKHSPFNLIYKDLRDGVKQNIAIDDVFIQLLDFDVT